MLWGKDMLIRRAMEKRTNEQIYQELYIVVWLFPSTYQFLRLFIRSRDKSTPT